MEILNIRNAKYIEPTNTFIDLILETDEGDMPFTYHPDDDAPASKEVKARLGSFTIDPYVPYVPTLDELKAEKTAYIQQQSNAAVNALKAGYTIGEIESFAQQKKGALDIKAGVESEEATYVKTLADIRVDNGDVILGALIGADRYTAFADKILANALAAEQATIAILGKQQGLEMQVRLASSKEQLDAIVW